MDLYGTRTIAARIVAPRISAPPLDSYPRIIAPPAGYCPRIISSRITVFPRKNMTLCYIILNFLLTMCARINYALFTSTFDNKN